MALQLLYTLNFQNSANTSAGFVSTDLLQIFWDDSAGVFATKKNGSTITSGGTITSDTTAHPPSAPTVNYNISDAAYRFCTGTTLSAFLKTTVYPYATRTQTANSSLCPVSGSDIHFLSTSPTVINPTTSVSTDGQINAVVISSVSSVKYALTDLTYAAMSNTTGVFTGLTIGNYTIYARDSSNAKTTRSVVLAVNGTSQTAVPITYSIIERLLFSGSSNSPTYVNGDTVIVYWDSASQSIKTYKNGTAYGTGPVLNTLFSGGKTTYPGTVVGPTGLQFCVGVDLKFFNFSSTYPYATIATVPNSPSCGFFVCDIHFVGDAQRGYPSTLTALDGSIKITAVSSIGDVRYTCQPGNIITPPAAPLYDVNGNSTGVFTGLGYGFYTIYARDNHNCLARYDVPIVAIENYGLQYEFSYFNQIGAHSKIQIYQNAYTGGTTQLQTMNVEPIELRLRGDNEDKFTPVIATEATIGLWSGTDQQWIPLFTDEDRKYRVIFLQDYGGGYTEIWRGFMVPGLYAEEYITPPYPVSFDCTDQIALLSSRPFANDVGYVNYSFGGGNTISGNVKLIKIISYILSKTGMNLPIRCGINVFEATMSKTIADDPLDQTYFDVRAYYDDDYNPKTCNVILADIMRLFGASIKQYGGRWWITRFEEMTGSFAWRDFDVDGNYTGNGTYNPVIDFKASTATNRALWLNNSQFMEGVASYGSIKVTQDLYAKKSLIKNFDFERASGSNVLLNVNFESWTNVLNGTQDVMLLATGKDSPTAAAIYSTVANIINPGATNLAKYYDNLAYLQSASVPYEGTTADAFIFQFDYYASAGNYNGPLPPVMKFKYSLRLIDSGNFTFYLTQDGTWSTESTNEWVNVFISSGFNDWSTVQIRGNLPPYLNGGSFSGGTIDVRLQQGDFRLNAVNCYSTLSSDFTGLTQLKAISTLNKPIGYVIWVSDVQNTSPEDTYYRFYKLTVSNAAESLPNTVRPNDWDNTTNRVEWIISNNDLNPNYYGQVSLFDNVILTSLPNGADAPTEQIHTRTNNSRVFSTYEKEIFHGDVIQYISDDAGFINASNARNIYTNYLRQANGDPIGLLGSGGSWKRPNRSEGAVLVSILTKFLAEQTRRPTFKLSGDFSTQNPDQATGITPGFINTFRDNGRYYVPLSMTITDRTNQTNIEMREFIPTDDGSNSGYTGGFRQPAFGGGYDVG